MGENSAGKVKLVGAVAEHFGVTRRAIEKWALLGMPGRDGDGYFDLEQIARWREARPRAGSKSARLSVRKDLVPVIARELQVTEPYLVKVFQQIKEHRHDISTYETNRKTKIILDEIKSSEIKDYCKDVLSGRVVDPDMTKKEAAVILDKIGLQERREYDMGRLERGESTENVAVIVQALREAQERRDARQKR